MHHVHRLRSTWILVMSPADVHGWYRIVFGAVCLECGRAGVYAAEQSTTHAAGRLLEPGR